MQKTIFMALDLDNLSDDELKIVEEIDDALLYYEFLFFMDEQIFNYTPALISKPNFDLRDFQSVEREFMVFFDKQDAPVINNPCIGIDGCKGGWICAVLESNALNIQRFTTLNDLVQAYPAFNSILIDMPVGLQSNQEHIRPDTYARQII